MKKLLLFQTLTNFKERMLSSGSKIVDEVLNSGETYTQANLAGSSIENICQQITTIKNDWKTFNFKLTVS